MIQQQKQNGNVNEKENKTHSKTWQNRELNPKLISFRVYCFRRDCKTLAALKIHVLQLFLAAVRFLQRIPCKNGIKY